MRGGRGYFVLEEIHGPEEGGGGARRGLTPGIGLKGDR